MRDSHRSRMTVHYSVGKIPTSLAEHIIHRKEIDPTGSLSLPRPLTPRDQTRMGRPIDRRRWQDGGLAICLRLVTTQGRRLTCQPDLPQPYTTTTYLFSVSCCEATHLSIAEERDDVEKAKARPWIERRTLVKEGE